jgi:3-hydroxy-9,10-secoandrosta-1,3,5(10)-triene-9,17-dione monooxygenase reductase component
MRSGPPTGDIRTVAPERLRQVAGTFPTGVTIITTIDDGRLHGCVANALTSVSLTPPTMLISLAHHSNTRKAILQSGVFGINVLPDADQSLEACRRFAEKSENKFSMLMVQTKSTGIPILEMAIGWMECKVVQTFESGDHTLIVGAVLDAEASDGNPLVFYSGQYHSILRKDQ